MNIFEAVKQSVTTRQAAEYYGIKVNKNGMCVCPFHNDKNPSMKVDRRFHCFGCQADGDVIDFVSRLYGLSSKEAALRLAQDFSIPYKDRKNEHREPVLPRLRQKTEELRSKQIEQRCFRVLSDYYYLLCRWETQFAPKTAEEEWNPLFVKALQHKSMIEQWMDILLFSGVEERSLFMKQCGKEIEHLAQRMGGLSGGDRLSCERNKKRSVVIPEL